MNNINTKVKAYIEEKDIESVKATLTGLAYVGDNESFQEFKDSTEYALSYLKDLFDSDDGKEFTMDYSIQCYKKVARLMMSNFSKQKYEAVIEIGTKLFEGKKAETVKNIKVDERKKEEKKSVSPFAKALKAIQNVIKAILKNPIRLLIGIILVVAIIVLIIKIK